MSEPNQEKEDKKPIELHSSIPTINQTALYFGVTEENPATNKITLKLTESIKNLKNALGKLDQGDHNNIRDILAQPMLPVTEDFSSKENIEKTTNQALANMKNDEGNKTIEELFKEKLKGKHVSEEDINKAAANLQQYMAIRILFGIREKIELEDLENEGNLAKHIASLEEHEDDLKKYSTKESSKTLITGITKQNTDESLLSALKEGKIGTKLNEGLYVVMNNGKPFVAITKEGLNKENIDKTIDVLKNSKKINWHNIPNKPDKLQNYAEEKTLQQWKKASFDKKETSLSKSMPNLPGAYAGWIKNIRTLPWHKNPKQNEKRLIQKIVGNDEKRLKDLWEDVVKNKDTDGMPKPQEIFDKLTDEQKTKLEEIQKNKMEGLQEKINNATNNSSFKERYEKQLENATEESAQMLSAKIKNIDDIDSNENLKDLSEPTKNTIKDKFYSAKEQEYIGKIKSLKGSKIQQIKKSIGKGELEQAIKDLTKTFLKHKPSDENNYVSTILNKAFSGDANKEITDKINNFIEQQPEIEMRKSNLPNGPG